MYASYGRWLCWYGAAVKSICQCTLSLSQLLPMSIRCENPFISVVSHSIIKGIFIVLWSPMRALVAIHLQMLCSVLAVVGKILCVFFVHLFSLGLLLPDRVIFVTWWY